MMKGLNLDIQETMTAVKPRPSTMVVVRVWSMPAVSRKPDEAAHSAGEHHGPDDDAVHLDAGVAGGALALAHHGDLVAVLAVLQVDVHQAGHDGDDQNGQQVLLARPDGAASLPAEDWLMMPILPAPLGTSHMMMKKAVSWVAM